jgi:hypothetical protein
MPSIWGTPHHRAAFGRWLTRVGSSRSRASEDQIDRIFLIRGLFAFGVLALALAAGAVATIHLTIEPAQTCSSCGYEFAMKRLFAVAVLAVTPAAGFVATIHFTVEPAQADCGHCG